MQLHTSNPNFEKIYTEKMFYVSGDWNVLLISFLEYKNILRISFLEFRSELFKLKK